MNRTWFVSPNDGQVVRVEHPLDCGANDEQWRSLIRITGMRIKNDTKPWGPLARRDFLNMLENDHPNRMARIRPLLFDSREAAERAKGESNDESKKEFDSPSNSKKEFETDGESKQIASMAAESPDKLLMAIELLRRKPNVTDEEVAAALALKTTGIARMWKILAREQLAKEGE